MPLIRFFLLAGLQASLALQAATPSYDVTTFGQFKGEVAADTAVIQAAIDACAAGGGGSVIVPGGTHVTVGSIRLRSHVALHLERGAVLLASPRHEDFKITNPYPVTTHPGDVAPAMGVMLYADEAEDVAITGAGTIISPSAPAATPAFAAGPREGIPAIHGGVPGLPARNLARLHHPERRILDGARAGV